MDPQAAFRVPEAAPALAAAPGPAADLAPEINLGNFELATDSEPDPEVSTASEASLGAYLFPESGSQVERPRPSCSRGLQAQHNDASSASSAAGAPASSSATVAPAAPQRRAVPLGAVIAAESIAAYHELDQATESIIQEELARPSCKPGLTLPLGVVIALDSIAAYHEVDQAPQNSSLTPASPTASPASERTVYNPTIKIEDSPTNDAVSVDDSPTSDEGN